MIQSKHNELDLISARRDIDKLLAQYFEQQIIAAQSIGSAYVRLWQSMQHWSLAGGKRLRPYMVLLAYHAFDGNKPHDVLPVAAAWELLHICMLIHDDIIDKDIVRYGIPNVAGIYQTYYQPLESSPEKRDHLANSAAILAGDLAHSGAHELILNSSLAAEQKILAQKYIAAATFTVAGGELLDTESVLYGMDDVEPLNIARYKTASYSFVGPLSTGATLAGASVSQIRLLEQLGDALGCGFQLADDILGLFGDESQTGKTTIGDIREGKRTFIMQFAFQNAGKGDRQVLERLVGKSDITRIEAETVKRIIIDSGAFKAAEDKIDGYAASCKHALAAIEADGIAIAGLSGLIDLCIRRIK